MTGCVALAGPVLGGAIAAAAGDGKPSREAAGQEDGAETASAADGADTLPPVTPTADAIAVPIAGDLPRPSGTENSPVTTFAAYVEGQVARDPVLVPRLSAVLREPSSLDGFRAFCGMKPVLAAIDLDSADAAVDPDALETDILALAGPLAALRAKGVAIAWISDLPPQRSAALRSALRESGLDPNGSDMLSLAEGGARKQLRREALQDSHCLVAILGDELADFDELFDYLIDPAAAWQLDEMMDEGWFLLAPTSKGASGPSEETETE